MHREPLTDSNSEIASRVLKKQIDLLYSGQLFAVVATSIMVILLFSFLVSSIDWMEIQGWFYALLAVLTLRLIFSGMYFLDKSNNAIDVKRFEFIYSIGIVSNGVVWGGVGIWLFPALDQKGQMLLMITILGLAAAAHTTMGYRKLPIVSFTFLLLLPLIIGVNISDFPNANSISIGIMIYLLFLLRSSEIFYKHSYKMLCLNEIAVDRENELLLQREIANSANKAKSEFLSRMSHELRTPLNAVLGLSELQLLDKNSPLTEKQASRSKKIGEAGKHLLSIVNDVLDLSRIETGSMDITLEVTCVSDVVKDAVRLVEDKAAQRNIILSTDMEQTEISVMADKQRLKQVIVNLLDNAIKYNKHGGNVSINVGINDDEKVRISIVDTGYGLKKESINELFMPFSRLGAEAIGIDGTGIGLSLCKELIELMDGSIGVNNRLGEGCCFWVELPYVALEGAIVKENYIQQLQVPVVSLVKVLLVEDNLVNSEVAVDMLEAIGVVVDVAYNGEEALERFSDDEYALILMDCEMPTLDGFAATKMIREIEEKHQRSSIPIIALTAHAVAGAREKCISSGMDDFLSKPFGLADLYNILNKWLGLEELDVAKENLSKDIRDIGEEINRFNCDTEVLDCSVIDKLYAKQKDNNSNFVSKIVNIYLEQSSNLLNNLTDSCLKSDAEAVRKIAHTLKSSSINVGAIPLSALCRRLEQSCEQGVIEEVLVEQLYQDYADVEQALKDILIKLS